jgi:hypothetical protein
LDAESPFPNSKEKAGRFVGIAENVGDALTFWILTEDTQQLIARSVVRTAEDPKTPNKCLDQLQPDKQTSQVVIGIKDLNKGVILPSLDPEQLLGYSFTTEHAGQQQRAEVKERINEEMYLVEYADGNDEHLTYEEIINLINKQTEEGHTLWTFTEILDHRKTNIDGKQTMEVLVKWDTGEPTWEPLNVIKADDPVTVASYVKKKNLKDQPY